MAGARRFAVEAVCSRRGYVAASLRDARGRVGSKARWITTIHARRGATRLQCRDARGDANMATEYQLFDPDDEVAIDYGRMPHWYQPGIAYFITYRTADSVPKALMDDWQSRRRAWLAGRGFSDSATVGILPAELRREYHRLFSEQFLEYLDRGHGECVLRRPAISLMALDAILHFDGDRYDIDSAVVMPNHVHILVGLRGETDLRKQCLSWKHFSAGRINRALGRRGEFWQVESFDHAVRSPGAFAGFRDYIANNPGVAGLKDGEYRLYLK